MLKGLFGLLVAMVMPFAASADDVEKVLFLTVEADEVIASNAQSGRFDRLQLNAKERIEAYEEANAVALVVTNQRFVGYGALAGGWQSIRREAGEKVDSMSAADYSANVVTSDRILNFYGRTGSWNQLRRGVQFR